MCPSVYGRKGIKAAVIAQPQSENDKLQAYAGALDNAALMDVHCIYTFILTYMQVFWCLYIDTYLTTKNVCTSICMYVCMCMC